MASGIGDRPALRLATIGVLVVLLVGLFVYAGTIAPASSDRNYPSEVDVFADGDRYVGDRVLVGGTVVAVDPVIIEAEPLPGETITFVVEGTAHTPEIGDQLTVYGTLQSENRIRTIEDVTREPWELYYMYVVSFLGGLWVLGRLVDGWTIDRRIWSVVPRAESLRSRHRGER